MDVENKLIGERLRKLRRNLGLSQEEVAEFVGIPRPSVSLIEQGKRDINVTELLKFCQVLRTDKDYLLAKKIEVSKNDSEDRLYYFVRHGEAMDDIFDMYGGWADPELSAKGVSKAYESINWLREKKVIPEIVLSSPLKRAKTKAEILANSFEVDLQVVPYLKERNTYGLLCGVNKEVANHSYPELVKLYKQGEFVLGSERYEDLLERLKLLWDFLKQIKFSKILCVTHGKLLTAIIEEELQMKVSEMEEDCLLVIGSDKKGFYYVRSEGISFLRGGEKL